jgi:hypothetical protein
MTGPRQNGPSGYTIQVAAFPDELSAERYVGLLSRSGENPVWGSVQLPGRGIWFRVLIGSFSSSETARRYGKSLMTRGLITEFLVKSVDEIRLLGRPRTKTRTESRGSTPVPEPTRVVSPLKSLASLAPVRASFKLTDVPLADVRGLPRPDPFEVATEHFLETANPGDRTLAGGLWLSGDVEDAIGRLHWIAGPPLIEAITVDETGRVRLNRRLVLELAGVQDVNDPSALARLRSLIASNEGLLLLVQVVEGAHRYVLHVGTQAMTRGGKVSVEGSINLDNNFDSRINPYRKNGKKLDRERPPKGFDAVIAINPSACWFNLHTGKRVPSGNITFHELAEAHAKVALGFQYLAREAQPGAHAIALEREMALKSQRPLQGNVVTIGSNRVFRTEEEIRRFEAEFRLSGGDQR